MELDHFISEMADNAKRIRALAEGVSSDQARWKPDPDSWSILEVVNHLLDIEFRRPAVPALLVPFVALFYLSILAMGLLMYRVSRRLWAITAVTTAVHLGAMAYAQTQGVG